MSFFGINQNYSQYSAAGLPLANFQRVPPATPAAMGPQPMLIEEIVGDDTATTQALLLGQQNKKKILLSSLISVFQIIDKDIKEEDLYFLTVRQFCELAKIILLSIGANKEFAKEFLAYFDQGIYRFDNKDKAIDFFIRLWECRAASTKIIIPQLLNALKDTFELMDLNLIQESQIALLPKLESIETRKPGLKFIFKALKVVKQSIEKLSSTAAEESEKLFVIFKEKFTDLKFEFIDYFKTFKRFEHRNWKYIAAIFEKVYADPGAIIKEAERIIVYSQQCQKGSIDLSKKLFNELIKIQVRFRFELSMLIVNEKVEFQNYLMQFIKETDRANHQIINKYSNALQEIVEKEFKDKLEDNNQLSMVTFENFYKAVLKHIGGEESFEDLGNEELNKIRTKLFKICSVIRKQWCVEHKKRNERYNLGLKFDPDNDLRRCLTQPMIQRNQILRMRCPNEKLSVSQICKFTLRILRSKIDFREYSKWFMDVVKTTVKFRNFTMEVSTDIIQQVETVMNHFNAYGNATNFFFKFLNSLVLTSCRDLPQLKDIINEDAHSVDLDLELAEESEVDEKSQAAIEGKGTGGRTSLATAAMGPYPSIQPITFIEPTFSAFHTTCSKAITCFGYAVAQLYGLDPRQNIKPSSIYQKKFSGSHVAVLQHLDLLKAFGRNLEMFERAKTVQSKVTLLNRVLLRSYLAVEQGITAECLVQDPQFQMRHSLGYMLRSFGIDVDNLHTKHNNRGTVMLRYPGDFAAIPQLERPFVLQNAVRGGSITVNEYSKLKATWIKDTIDLSVLYLAKRFGVNTAFFTHIKQIAQRIIVEGAAASETDIKVENSEELNNRFANLSQMAASLDALMPMMQKKISRLVASQDGLGVKADATLPKALDHAYFHLKQLRDNILEIPNFLAIGYLEDHAQAVVLHAQHVLYFLAKFRFVSSKRAFDLENLMNLHKELEHFLTAKQVKTLKSLIIGKGAEYIFRYFNETSSTSAYMQLLNDLNGETDPVYSAIDKIENSILHKRLLALVEEVTSLTIALVKIHCS